VLVVVSIFGFAAFAFVSVLFANLFYKSDLLLAVGYNTSGFMAGLALAIFNLLFLGIGSLLLKFRNRYLAALYIIVLIFSFLLCISLASGLIYGIKVTK